MRLATAKTMALLFAGSIVLGFSLLVAVYAIPSSWMEAMFDESAHILQQEGAYRDINSFDTTSTLDNFTTAVMLDEAIHSGIDDGGGVVNAAMYVGRHDVEGVDIVDGLPSAADYPATEGYEWYWHGYLILLKPLLIFFNITEIRTLLFLVLSLALVVGSCVLYKMTRSLLFPAAYAVSLVSVNYFAVAQSPSLVLVFIIAALAVIVVLRNVDEGDFGSERFLLPFFFAVGIVVAYFDFFTTPVVSLAYPLIAYCLVKRPSFEDSSWLQVAKTIMLCSACWVVGYGFFWISKWLIATVVLGYDVIGLAIDHVFLWSGTAMTDEQSKLFDGATPLTTVLKNFSMMVSAKMLLLLAAVLLAIAFLLRQRKSRVNAKQMLAVGVIALYPLLWYFATSNHAFWHTFLTFRSLSVLVFGVLSMFALFFSTRADAFRNDCLDEGVAF